MNSTKPTCHLVQEVAKDLVIALKAGDKIKVSTLRMLKATFGNVAINKREAIDETEAEQIVKTEIKKHQDSIIAFKEGGRENLVLVEEKELKILEKYLPPQLSEDEVKKIVQAKAQELGELTTKDFGKLMGAVMGELQSKADGGLVGRVVKAVLEGKIEKES